MYNDEDTKYNYQNLQIIYNTKYQFYIINFIK